MNTKQRLGRAIAALTVATLATAGVVATAEPAEAGGFTQTCNTGAWSLAFGVSTNNRVNFAPLSGGACIWGTTHIRVQVGHCVYVAPHQRTYRAVYGSPVWVLTNWQGRGNAWRVSC